MVAGGAAASKLGTTIAIEAVRKIGQSSTRDRLLKLVRQHPDVPDINWRERHRLMKLLKTPDAEAALLDQDEDAVAALSTLLARSVFRDEPSQRSGQLAQVLMTVFPAALKMEHAFGALSYKLRRMEASQHAEFERLGRRVEEIHHAVGTGTKQIDPDVLLQGPLQGLDLLSDYRHSEELGESDPRAAADLLDKIITRVEAAGYSTVAGPLRLQRARARTRSRDAVGAAAAWLPMIEQHLFAGDGAHSREAIRALETLSTEPGAPEWLQPRATAVAALDGWIDASVTTEQVLDAAKSSAHAGDPVAGRWLMLAAECAIADRELSQVAALADLLSDMARKTSDPIVQVRLRLAVADASGDENIWKDLVNDATPGSGNINKQGAALIMARRARLFAWSSNSEASVSAYRFAIERGCRAEIWDDAAAWAHAAFRAESRGTTINFRNLNDLPMQANAIRVSGRGSLLRQSYDPHKAALTDLAHVDAQGEPKLRSAHLHLRRFLRNSITTAHLEEELVAHQLLGRVYQESNRPGPAMTHFILAGDASSATRVAGELAEYVDCLADAQSPQYQCRAAALAAAAAQADLIPDSLVYQWCTHALSVAVSRDVAPGQMAWVNAYKVLAGLSYRIPEEVIDRLLTEIGTLLDRERDTRTHVDRQIARILIGIGKGSVSHQSAVAEYVATAFERAGDVADELAISVDTLTPHLRHVEQRLRALVTARGDRRAVRVLVELGDRSEAVVDIAEKYVAGELTRPPAYSQNSVSILGNVYEPAFMATCLPTERRIQLARHFADRVLDVNDAEDNRESFATACAMLAQKVPDAIRSELFQQLLPLVEVGVDSQSIFDVIEQRFQDPLGSFRIRKQSGLLRRRVISTLRSLAFDDAQKVQVWAAAQRLFKTGDSGDALVAARIGYELVKCRPSHNSPGVSVTEFPMPGCAESRVAGPAPGSVQFAVAVRFPGRLRGR